MGRGDAETDAGSTVGPLTARSTQSLPATFGRQQSPAALVLTSRIPSSPKAWPTYGGAKEFMHAHGSDHDFARAEAGLVPFPKGCLGALNRVSMESDKHPSRASTTFGGNQSLTNL